MTERAESGEKQLKAARQGDLTLEPRSARVRFNGVLG